MPFRFTTFQTVSSTYAPKKELVLIQVDNITYINSTRFYLTLLNIPLAHFNYFLIFFPQHNKAPYDVSLNEKKDASVFFKDRSLILTVGKFLDLFCTKENTNHPCLFELKNHQQAEIKYQANNIF